MKVKKFFNFFSSNADLLFILALLLFPVNSQIRVLLSHSDPKLEMYVSLSFLVAQVFFIFLVPRSKTFRENLISIFMRGLNLKVVQQLLFICIWFEQLLLTHTLVLCIEVAAFTLLYCSSFTGCFPVWLLLHLFLIIGTLYFRIRRSILNQPAFESVGIQANGAFTWSHVVSGLNSVLQKKFSTYAVAYRGRRLAKLTFAPSPLMPPKLKTEIRFLTASLFLSYHSLNDGR